MSTTLPRICTPATSDEHRVPSLSSVERRERAISSVVSPRPQRERGTSEQPNKKKSHRRRPFGDMDQDEETMEVSKKSVIAKIFKVRKRREMLVVQVCFICSVLFMAWCMSALLTKAGHGMLLEGGHEVHHNDHWGHDLWGRKLMASASDDNETEEKNCTEPAIHEFPNDMFTNAERKKGAVLLHITAALYMFLALAIVCDDYFVTSLEKICEKLDLSEDVAGATFMAAGSSAPELFASVIGVFITHGDVGVGTIVGSAVFNILCIIGVCGIFAGQVVMLTKYAVFRDSICYIFSVVALILFIYDEKIVWWESLVLVVMYSIYILIMKFNSSIQSLFASQWKKNVANGNAASGSELEDVKPTKAYSRGSVVMVDEIINARPPKYRFPEAGLRQQASHGQSPHHHKASEAGAGSQRCGNGRGGRQN